MSLGGYNGIVGVDGDKNLVDKNNEIIKLMEETFAELCNKNPPQAFMAFTVGKDMAVNFASYGVSQEETKEVLKHMLEHMGGSDESEEEIDFGKTDNTTIH